MDLSNPLILLIAVAYYALIGLATFFSVFAVYILVRYGRSRGLSLAVAIVYCMFFLSVLQISYHTLTTLS